MPAWKLGIVITDGGSVPGGIHSDQFENMGQCRHIYNWVA